MNEIRQKQSGGDFDANAAAQASRSLLAPCAVETEIGLHRMSTHTKGHFAGPEKPAAKGCLFEALGSIRKGDA
jgi:hypothetical protein